jgi:uncharacterized protein (DUF3084 family)
MTLKDQIERQLETKLNEWKTEIDKAEAEARAAEAKAEAEHADAEAKKAAWQKADELKRQLEKGEKKLAELKNATEDGWESLKDEINRLVA